MTPKELSEIRARCAHSAATINAIESNRPDIQEGDFAHVIECAKNASRLLRYVGQLEHSLGEATKCNTPLVVIKQRTAVGDYICPSCGVAFIDSPLGGPICKTNYCGNCGQRLGWEE